eukprot:CAMPEP_0168567446 /NCGR_PEP_ID=MMETSP0413-20121227/15015_1 /TAXON_ID=136452 /ORGANISM="Filamoeba nolandi, Strain NC-AS-23-1" /LENGTH=182 /DNA_ID=CAMNT_0008599649 /DNA_START=61 /DNA_END=606 /DNA_ORIENTATION=-
MATKDAIEIIINDHNTVRGLFQKIKDSTDPVVRRENMNLVIKELCQHSEAEELVVYPALRTMNHNLGNNYADRSINEHLAVKNTLARLDGLDATSPEFDVQFNILVREIEQHTLEEETQVLPFMRQHMTKDDLHTMANLFEGAKIVSPTRPHPSAPTNPVAKGLVAPITAFIDRLKDAGRQF